MKTKTPIFFLPGCWVATAVCVTTLNMQAAVVGVPGDDSAPGATLGPFLMTPFGPDGRAEFDVVNSVASPLGGALGFSPDLTHLIAGSGWGSWSHGFTGDVYWTDGNTSLELTLPPDTAAFYFFAQPNSLQSFEITAETQDGTLISQIIDGNGGASSFGFYGTAGDFIEKISISSTEEFAIGEFGIARPTDTVPETPSWAVTLSLVGLVGMHWAVRRLVPSRIGRVVAQ